MSAPSDPAGVTAAKDPAHYRRPRALPAGAGATLAFGSVCLLAGAGAALLIERWERQ